jgi:hypothetical protein
VVAPALAAAALATCPRDTSLGRVTFARTGHEHIVALRDCRDRVVGRAKRPLRTQLVYPSPDGRFAARLRTTRSASLDADGVRLDLTSGGRTRRLGFVLAYPDYLTWCGPMLVFSGGGDRLATYNKRLLATNAFERRVRSLWPDRRRAFGSVTCAPDGESVVVLSQPASSVDYNALQTRWELWRVGFNGTRTLLDRPPPGYADESPRWSRDQRALLFVRERRGVGRLMLWRGGSVTGPIAALGSSPGYYGHRDWWATMSWSVGFTQ